MMTEQNSYICSSQSDIAIQIEQLIKAVQRTATQAFRITYSTCGDEQAHATELSKYFDGIEQMVVLLEYGELYQCSWYLRLFQEACQAIGIELSPCGITCLNEGETRYLSTSVTLNELTKHIRVLLAAKTD